MPLSKLHTLTRVGGVGPFPTSSYEHLRNEEIKRSENDPLRVGQPGQLDVDVDIAGRLVIGYGYDLQARPASESQAELNPHLAPGVSVTNEQVEILEAYRVGRAVNLPGPPPHALHGAIPTRSQVETAWGNIVLASEVTATDLLTTEVNDWEAQLDAHLGFTMADSKERAALVSMAYNGGLALIGPILSAHLFNDDRAAAWIQIRYYSNLDRQNANRRYRESDLFGLHDDETLAPSTPSELEQQAKEVLRAYTIHRDHIRRYEAQFSPVTIAAGSSGIDQQIASDRTLLIETFITNENQIVNKPSITGEVLVGSDNSLDPRIAGAANNDLILGEGGHDTLHGEGGDDVLYGGADGDHLFGGTGNDTLVGGTGDDSRLDGGLGNDTYIWNSGDGLDTITDAREMDGIKSGTIQFMGLSLAGSKTQIDPSNPQVFEDVAVPGIRYTLIGTSGVDGILKIDKQGEPGGLELSGFKSGDFGIIIPPPATIIKSDSFGTENNDTALASDSANQKVFGLAGNDRVTVSHANTEGYGGLGSDFLTNDIGDQKLYGDEGSDVLLASEGSDELYGGADGDALQGGADDDYLEGNGGGDVLDGGLGSDVIYGGDGNDFIVGGGTLTVQGWSASNPPSFGTTTVNGVTGPAGVVGLVAIDDDGADFIDAGLGIDTVFAGSGNDFARGGADNDLVVGLAHDDVLEGNDGVDALYGDATQGHITLGGQPFYTLPEFHGSDVLWGGAGNDSLTGDGGTDELYGEGEDDTLMGDATGLDEIYHGADYLDGGEGNDTLYGYGKDDVLFGGAGNDRLEGDSNTVAFDKHGDDYLDGEAGDDHVQGDGGSDTLFGGDGVDQLFGDSDDTPLANQGGDYLDGEAGDDFLRGYAGNDTLFGGDDADQLLGEAGDDYLDGESGNDLMSGGEGNDQLLGGLGIDDLQGDAGDDFLDGGDGDDLLFGGSGADELFGGAGVDQLAGEDGDDILDGGDGNDTLFGDAGNDTLIGGAGADVFVGGAGNDTFVASFADGDGVVDTEGANTLQMAYGGAVSALSIDQGFDVEGLSYLVLTEGLNQVSIQAGFAGAVSSFDFGGGVVLSQRELMSQAQSAALTLTGSAAADSLMGGSSADQINAGAGADILEGLGGNDTLAGGFGADIYVVSRGAGQDVIQESDDGSNAIDKVRFAADVATTDVAVSRTTNDLVLTITPTADTVTVAGYFTSAMQMVEEFQFDDGTVWNDAIIAQKLSSGTAGNDIINGTAGNDLLNGLGGNDTLSGSNGDDRLFGESGVDTLNGNNGADILDGGLDSDFLNGGSGGDTYVFARGDGQDFISESDDGTNPIDRIEFAADILPADVAVRRNFSDLQLNINGSSDRVTVSSYFFGDAVGPRVVEQVRLGDGTIWDVAAIKALALAGTAGADTLTGYASDDVINGAAGADAIEGMGGNDTLNGGDGNDNIGGGEGDDVIAGGGQNDTLRGNGGNDTYLYNLGDGSDTISNTDASTATTDKLIFGPGITPANLTVTRGGTPTDLLLLTSGGIVTLSGYFGTLGNANEIDEIRFTDDPATVWTVAGVRAMLLQANDFANTLVGYDTNDTIDGLGGDDLIQGVDGNDTLLGGAGNDTIAGGRGTDTLAGGAGDDRLYGEEQSQDILAAQSGGDTLDGGTGRDQLFGRRGNDTYVFGRGYGHDSIDEATFFSDGVDTLRLNADVVPADVTLYRHGDDLVVTIAGDPAQAWISQYYTLANKPIEQIVFDNGTVWDVATIASLAITGTQNAMTGTAGNDTFVVDHVGDTITEGVNQGTDTIQSGVSYNLPANVENITLTGILDINSFGNNLNNTMTGNAGDNVLGGSDGADTLNGGLGDDILDGGTGDDALNGGAGNDKLEGGTGIDTLSGGAGDDTYTLGNFSEFSSFDTVTEAVGEGEDTVIALLGSYTLAANVENLIMGSNTFVQRTAIGNALDNAITVDFSGVVGSQDFLIDGGAGADRMTGNSSDDTYVVDNAGDVVIEFATFGDGSQASVDTVRSSVDHTLTANVENLELQGAGTLSGTGNALNNSLVGNGGANALSGLGGNDTLFGGAGIDTLTGGQGNDVYVLADIRAVVSGTVRYGVNSPASVNEDAVVEAAGEGTDTVQTLFNYTLTDNVENLVLLSSTTGILVHALQGTGNALANQITGNIADNVIDGGAGADTMIGGQGNDTYYVDEAGDVVTELAGGGVADRVISQASYTLGAEVENLTLAGAGAVSGTGNALANRLDGSQNSAANVLAGGLGDDVYIAGDGDTILENASEGTDTVESSVSYALGANVENLVLTGSAATTGTGDALDNRLDGSQNSAANTLAGGLGNDLYIVDSGDLILENAGEGVDTVTAAFSYTLGANVENLTLTGAAVSATGSADDNLITGNALGNMIDGGAGADAMSGGQGNDTYYVDDAGDVVTELAGGGTADTVISQVSYTLGAEVENLVLAGSGAISGTGNAQDNTLDGMQNSAANVLAGGLGNDTYLLGDGDTIVENAGEGIDTVRSSSSFVLAGEIENLVLLGAAAIDGTGNALDNTLSGNDAANVLDGGGGADTLIGGAGDDTYRFAPGMGDDVVFEGDATAGNIDTLELGAGIAPADVVGSRVGDDLVLSFTGSSGTVTLGSFYSSPDNEIERVVFFGGTVWDVAMLKSIVAITGTSGADTLNGTSGDDRILGLGGNDTLNGNAGNDFLDGGTGSDTMNGGTGDDAYVVDNTGDVVTESSSSGGTDTVESSVTRTLGSNQENLSLTGTAAINGTGNTLANVLRGNSGTNTLAGGTGNDQYYVSTGDSVTEGSSAGTDTVFSDVNWTLGSNIERLTLLGTVNINATGNTLANFLTGNAGNNTLNGGTGADTMIGGLGDDTYVVDHGSDSITENANEGIDTVRSTLAWTLGSNLEILTLTGTANINGTGNALANILTGNFGNNTLTGNAGNDTLDGQAGSDTLIGGTGNDTYLLGRGHGAELVQENDATSGNTDIGQFLENIAPDQIWFQQSGSNLVASVIGTPDQFTVQNWYTGSQYRVEQFRTSDGQTLMEAQVQNLVDAMAAFSPPPPGQETLPPDYAAELNPTIAANWQ